MIFSVNSKFKLFLTITLSLIVVGVALLAIFGFNTTLENRDGYEITFGIEQNLPNKSELAKQSVDNLLNEKGIRVSNIQSLNKGAKYIYKFDSATNIDDTELKSVIENAINDSSISIIASVDEVKDVNTKTTLGLLWALLIVIAFVFVYLFFVEKLKNTLSVFAVSFISTILFLALIGLTRIPVYPTLMSMILFTFAFSSCLSLVMTNRFKHLVNLSGNENESKEKIADIGAMSSLFRIAVISIIAIVFSIAFIFCGSYMFYIGLQLIVSVLSSAFVVFSWTPIIWSKLKIN